MPRPQFTPLLHQLDQQKLDDVQCQVRAERSQDILAFHEQTCEKSIRYEACQQYMPESTAPVQEAEEDARDSDRASCSA